MDRLAGRVPEILVSTMLPLRSDPSSEVPVALVSRDGDPGRAVHQHGRVGRAVVGGSIVLHETNGSLA